MAQLTVSVPQELRAWAEQRVTDGLYPSTNDYLSELIRRDQERTERLHWLRAEVEKGFASGVSTRTLQDILDAQRAKRAAA